MKNNKKQAQELISFKVIDKSRNLYGFTDNSEFIGKMNLYWQTQENIFLNIEPISWNKKQLEQMIYLSMSYVFDELNIPKLSCELSDERLEIIDIYLSQGFEQEGLFKQQLLKEDKLYNVHRLRCFKSDFDKYLKNYNLAVINGIEFSINVGDMYTEEIVINNKDIMKFSEVSGDENPIHLSTDYAISKGFKSNIVHGMLSASFFSKILGTKFPGNGSIYISQKLTFLIPIYPNEKIVIKLKVLSIIGSKFIIKTQILKQQKIALEGVAKIISKKNPTLII